MSARKTIAVFPPANDARIGRLLQCLGAAFNVDFSPIASLELLRQDAVILLADDDAALLKSLASFPAVFSAPGASPPSSPSPPLAGATRFSDEAALAAPLRGQTLAGSAATRVCVAALSGFAPLASVAEVPAWTVSRERLHCRSNLAVDGIGEHEELIGALQEPAFLSVLPLVDFVRRLSADDAWDRPALRATLIIDDPNLHSRRYGCLDYEAFGRHARQIGFHACMATVPLDGWLVNPRAAKIFRDFGDVLSIAAHGNDHEYRELAQAVSADQAERIIGQANRRIAHIELKSGCPVGKVMIPPHGACSEVFLKTLARAGYLGATTTRGAIWENNDLRGRPLGSGMSPAEIVGGLPIAHRFRFNANRWPHRVAISAYLRHPLIAHGHTEDFAGGLGAFDSIAERINDLGARWGSPAELFASNFESRRVGNALWIRPYSRSVVVPLNGEYSEVKVDLENFPDRQSETLRYANDNSPEATRLPAGAAISFGTAGVRQTVLTIESENPIDLRKVPARRTRLASVARRVLSEGMDRWGRRCPPPQP